MTNVQGSLLDENSSLTVGVSLLQLVGGLGSFQWPTSVNFA